MEPQCDRTEQEFNWLNFFIVIVLFLGLAYYICINYFLRATGNGDITHCQSKMKKIGTALEMYAADNYKKYPPKMEMLAPDYFKNIPSCEAHKSKLRIIVPKRFTYEETYMVNADLTIYTFYCGGKNHEAVGCPENYPLYDSINGLQVKP